MKKITINNMPKLPYEVDEALNRLRVNISFLGSDIKKIMIISTDPDEGKSFVAIQLWKQMAESGTKSILIDADMRKSVMADKYEFISENDEKLKGISNFLSGDSSIEDVIMNTQWSCGDILPNIDNVINPSMLIDSNLFELLLEYVSTNYRYVFVDAPPLSLVSDGEKIGSLCDGAVLVVRSGVTSKHMVKNSINQLERAGCPLLGIVLNRVDNSKAGYYYKRYGGKYYGGKYYGKKYYGDAYYGS